MDAVPDADDQHERRRHDREEGGHEALSFASDGLTIRQTQRVYFVLHGLGIEKQAVQRAVSHAQLHHQREQGAVQDQLDNNHSAAFLHLKQAMPS